ncbi:hypothetical protein [Pseudomonas sp. 24 E 13]|nr:hypothetical protein [Pseudomonas sp. 24 E 13]CRM98692.1 hypothetical protein [Pseudomonas sp. 34 E 7]
MINVVCQCSLENIATTAANAPPSGTPQYITLMAVPRLRSLTASAHSAIRLGSAAPRPRPVRKRTSNKLE